MFKKHGSQKHQIWRFRQNGEVAIRNFYEVFYWLRKKWSKKKL